MEKIEFHSAGSKITLMGRGKWSGLQWVFSSKEQLKDILECLERNNAYGMGSQGGDDDVGPVVVQSGEGSTEASETDRSSDTKEQVSNADSQPKVGPESDKK